MDFPTNGNSAWGSHGSGPWLGLVFGTIASIGGTIQAFVTPDSLPAWAIGIGGFLFAVGNAVILLYHRWQGAMRDEYIEWAKAEVEAARIRAGFSSPDNSKGGVLRVDEGAASLDADSGHHSHDSGISDSGKSHQ